MKKIIAASFIVFVGTPALAKEACLTQSDPKVHSAWRTIEGKQCWYRGYRGRARESLYWEAPAREREVPPQTLEEAEPLKDQLDHAFTSIEANQPQPPIPRPKPQLSRWEKIWQKWEKWKAWWWGGS